MAMASSSSSKDLSEYIDKAQSFCLNQDPSHPMPNLFMGDERLFLQSDSDEQLLISVAFKETVTLEAINFVAPLGEDAPQKVKLFINDPSMSFSDCEEGKATQTLDLAPEDLDAEVATDLYSVKFQRVTNLVIFVEEANGGDVTKISSLKLFGSPVQGTNMYEFKKVG